MPLLSRRPSIYLIPSIACVESDVSLVQSTSLCRSVMTGDIDIDKSTRKVEQVLVTSWKNKRERESERSTKVRSSRSHSKPFLNASLPCLLRIQDSIRARSFSLFLTVPCGEGSKGRRRIATFELPMAESRGRHRLPKRT